MHLSNMGEINTRCIIKRIGSQSNRDSTGSPPLFQFPPLVWNV